MAKAVTIVKRDTCILEVNSHLTQQGVTTIYNNSGLPPKYTVILITEGDKVPKYPDTTVEIIPIVGNAKEIADGIYQRHFA